MFAGILLQAALVLVVYVLLRELGPSAPAGYGYLPIVGAIGLVLGIGVGGLAVVRARAGGYATAEDLLLVLGIFEIPLGFGVTGLFFLGAYVKFGQADTESRKAGPAVPGVRYAPSGPPLATGQGTNRTVIPPNPNLAAMPPPPVIAPSCPRCRAATSWVAQYSRYFCYGCRTYV